MPEFDMWPALFSAAKVGAFLLLAVAGVAAFCLRDWTDS